ncbi:probable G-protein coupled receptor 156 [Paramormyrops kingsleyae]|uniref:probable G-protein coupled receptor 156 n=1 Tax=Paramormyrops kingsleyae TaxID=1676925 RepID=UPI003B96BC13
MDTALNCSRECSSGHCVIDPWISSREAWVLLQRLCTLSTAGWEAPQRPLSPVLRAVVWTLLSSGILVALLFLTFTLRCRNNRIVKMSSPNLNVLTLCGSLLTYSSGFLFGVEEKSLLPSAGPKTVLQARIWTLCIGSSLVFGPILGKTWRLYRVFTQRVPDKRVIIRDSQLMGLVALLILIDVLVLSTWGLTDPLQCGKSIRAAAKVLEHEVSYSLFQQEFCSSHYSDIWIVLLSVLKGSLLLYGTYLAGLTNDVSWPPVNQSLTIMAAACLVTLSVALSIPVSRLLQSWPNVVYSVVSGSIFVCTLATNCLLFVPQVAQWKQFQEELNPSSSQMAKYFSSPSKSLQSMYSEDEIFYLRGENSSVKRLLMEKNAVIDSLQEQVNNAKEKLLKLMSADGPGAHHETDSSANLNSSSTQITQVQLEPAASLSETDTTAMDVPLPNSLLPGQRITQRPRESVPKDTDYAGGKSDYIPEGSKNESDVEETLSMIPTVFNSIDSPGSRDLSMSDVQRADSGSPLDSVTNTEHQPLSYTTPTGAEESVPQVKRETPLLGGKHNFVSSEKLQEILLDLSVDAITTSLKSPKWDKGPSSPSPEESSHKFPYRFCYPGISPYIMRKRRPPFHSSRAGLSSYCYSRSVPSVHRKSAATFYQNKHPPVSQSRSELDTTVSQPQRSDSGVISGGGEGEAQACHSPGWQKRASSGLHGGATRTCTIMSSTGCDPSDVPTESERLREEQEPHEDQYCYSDSDSSSSEENYCCYHSSYCKTCAHRQYESMDSTTSETSDSESGGFPSYCHIIHPVVNFKDDLQPTFV